MYTLTGLSKENWSELFKEHQSNLSSSTPSKIVIWDSNVIIHCGTNKIKFSYPTGIAYGILSV